MIFLDISVYPFKTNDGVQTTVVNLRLVVEKWNNFRTFKV